MATMKVYIPSGFSPTPTTVHLVPEDESTTGATGAISLSANGDGWWLADSADTIDYIDNYDVYINGTKTTQSEGLGVFYGNKYIKTHIEDTDIHTTAADKTSWDNHVATTTGNPHQLSVSDLTDGDDVATIDDASTTSTTDTWSVDKLYSDEIGSRDWNSNAIASGVDTGDNCTEAINALATTVVALDPTNELFAGVSRTIVGTNYDEVAVTSGVTPVSVLITCANMANYNTLRFYCDGKADATGQFQLYIDDTLEATAPILTSSYSGVSGSYDVSDLTGNAKIELKVLSVTLGSDETDVELSSVVLES